MHIIVCLDNRNGMCFGGRRQSMDRAVRQDMLNCYAPILTNSYGAGPFREGECVIDENYLSHAQTGDSCFVENTPVTAFMENAEMITVYRWNRDYPADLHFPSLEGYQCVERREIAGFSHPSITKEVYTQCGHIK